VWGRGGEARGGEVGWRGERRVMCPVLDERGEREDDEYDDKLEVLLLVVVLLVVWVAWL